MDSAETPNYRVFAGRVAAYGLGSETGAQVVPVACFAAVQTSSAMRDQDSHCIVPGDVAPGQSLWVQYSNLRGDCPGIDHARACAL